MKIYYLIYKTTCIITKRYYIGMHKTKNEDDGYLGSGIKLGASIEKYGKENHIRIILSYHNSRKDMVDREVEIVNENLLKDPLCMNLKLGGYGGSVKCSEATKSKISATLKGRPGYSHTEAHKEYMRGQKRGPHSQETRDKISAAGKGRVPWNKGKKGQSAWNKGLVLATNGIDKKYIPSSELSEEWYIEWKRKKAKD